MTPSSIFDAVTNISAAQNLVIIIRCANVMESDLPLEGRDLSTVTDTEFMHGAKTGPLMCDKGTRIEASNMEYVFNHANGHIRVPYVYRTFTSGHLGYIAMDFVDGESLDAIPWSERTVQERHDIVMQVTEGLVHIRSLRRCQPGPRASVSE
ncbi:hypothetical protein BDV95DRAFT_265741 [Massariosphaeria phaeospora]|uniref:Protein kinase domain-containing protein n=1 Tax=Massariosphaeria phaeospora TaxID=100035 RepID=A0A7C8I4P6_9PLEO|nr:hypothetical protein BDV95DRAFT_265741 [Massariosphaeria phaeospora]